MEFENLVNLIWHVYECSRNFWSTMPFSVEMGLCRFFVLFKQQTVLEAYAKSEYSHAMVQSIGLHGDIQH